MVADHSSEAHRLVVSFSSIREPLQGRGGWQDKKGLFKCKKMTD